MSGYLCLPCRRQRAVGEKCIFFTGVFRRTQEGQHLCRNQFKSVNTFEQSYDHIYYKTGPIVQEEEIFKFCENTFAILLLSPDVKRCGLSI